MFIDNFSFTDETSDSGHSTESDADTNDVAGRAYEKLALDAIELPVLEVPYMIQTLNLFKQSFYTSNFPKTMGRLALYVERFYGDPSSCFFAGDPSTWRVHTDEEAETLRGAVHKILDELRHYRSVGHWDEPTEAGAFDIVCAATDIVTVEPMYIYYVDNPLDALPELTLRSMTAFNITLYRFKYEVANLMLMDMMEYIGKFNSEEYTEGYEKFCQQCILLCGEVLPQILRRRRDLCDKWKGLWTKVFNVGSLDHILMQSQGRCELCARTLNSDCEFSILPNCYHLYCLPCAYKEFSAYTHSTR